MTSETRGRWMLVAGLIGVLVFLGVCGTVLKGVRDDRAAIEARVGWLMGLQTTESPADATRAVAAARAVSACADCLPATREAAAGWLRVADANVALGDPPSPAAVAGALRAENAAISAQLGAAWNVVELLLVCAVAFALGFFALLRVALNRGRARQAAYDALAAETRTREQAQRVLESEQAFSNSFFEFTPLGIQIFDADGLSLRMNGEMARMLGLPSRDVGVGVFNILTDPAAVKGGYATRAAPAFRGEVVEYRGQIARPEDTAPFWPVTAGVRVFDELYFPVRDTAGRVVSAVAVFRDDTEGQAARQRLGLSERMAAVGTLAAGVAHEINNPMTYVAANIAWLLRELETEGEALPDQTRAAVLESLREAHDGVARVRAIVRDLGTFSRASPGVTATVRLSDAVEPVLRMLAHETRHRATVINRVPDTLSVHADPLTLGQVVLNLVQNAAHAIEPGQPSAEHIELTAAPLDDGRVRLSVADSGRGIPLEIAARVFDPFFTTKPVGQGMGLGLSVSRGIVNALGGQLTFARRPGGGTCFHVDLPVARPQQALSVPPTPTPAPRRTRLLIVDDEPMLTTSLRRLLGRRHEVVGAGSGAEALAMVAQDRAWDAILLDVMMPEMDGRAVLEALETQAPELAPRVILMSGGTFSADSEAFWRSFKGPQLNKPFETDTLEHALAQVAEPGPSQST
jgi:signal transduction histidine kinase/ActR/RegA family two-component response regulator